MLRIKRSNVENMASLKMKNEKNKIRLYYIRYIGSGSGSSAATYVECFQIFLWYGRVVLSIVRSSINYDINIVQIGGTEQYLICRMRNKPSGPNLDDINIFPTHCCYLASQISKQSRSTAALVGYTPFSSVLSSIVSKISVSKRQHMLVFEH